MTFIDQYYSGKEAESQTSESALITISILVMLHKLIVRCNCDTYLS